MNDKTKLAIAATGVAAGLIARTFYQHSHEREIEGDVVLITGGDAEFSLGLARRFAREGCRVALCSAEQIEASGAHIVTFPCNVVNPVEAALLIDEVTRHFGRIDILINSVLINSVSAENLAPGESEAGVIYPTLALLPQMMKRNSGKVVNITSSVSKAAAGFSEGIAADLALTGVSVSTLDSRLTPTARQVLAAVKRTEVPKTSSPVTLNSPNMRTLMMLGRLAARHFGQRSA
jgi:NAD(P)-dependent dehydrogenase (short-subunit alcohol dehydrogenase family)